MPTLANTAEGGVEDATVTTGNSGGASGDAFDAVLIGGTGAVTYDNAQARGVRAFKVVGDTGTSIYLAYTTSLGTVAQAWGRTYLYLTGNPGAVTGIVRGRVGGAQVFRISISTTGLLQIRDASNSLLATMTSAIALNQWVRVEWRCLATAASGDLECRLYNTADSTSVTDSVSDLAAVLANNLDEINYGHHSAAVVSTLWMDDLQVNTTAWPGPSLIPTVHLLAHQSPKLAVLQRAASW